MPDRWRNPRRNLQLWHLGGLGCAVCLDVRSALHLVYTSRWLTRMTLMQHRVLKPGSPCQITKARYEHKTAFILHNINSLNVFEVDLTWVYLTVKNHSTLRCRCLGCYEQCSLLVQSGGCVQWLLSSSWRGGFGRGLRLSRNLHCLRAFQPCGISFAAFSIHWNLWGIYTRGPLPCPKEPSSLALTMWICASNINLMVSQLLRILVCNSTVFDRFWVWSSMVCLPDPYWFKGCSVDIPIISARSQMSFWSNKGQDRSFWTLELGNPRRPLLFGQRISVPFWWCVAISLEFCFAFLWISFNTTFLLPD